MNFNIKNSAICILVLLPVFAAAAPPAMAQMPAQNLAGKALLNEVERRAFRFFWEKSDPTTGLTNDRAKNIGAEDQYTVASTASTGYALSSLPIAVTHKWISNAEAYQRALLTLTFVKDRLPVEHGWYYHFVDKRTGARVWNCELSSVDTCLLLLGSISAGEFWKGTEVQKIAGQIYDRVDWTWMRTNGGTQPNKLTVSMGWNPENGFLKSEWNSYCELIYIYLLGMGASGNPLPAESWKAWSRTPYTYGKHTALAGGPIFMHQMAHLYYNMQNQRDSEGWDYWVSSVEATQMNRDFCIDHADKRKTYGPNIWGLNACDYPDGYNAFGVPSPEDGTISTTGAIASLIFTPALSRASAEESYSRFSNKLWGRYGFSDSFNLDRNWFDPDVIGIDLGMAMLAIEDAKTGLPWKLMASHPSTKRALQKAGFHHTKEAEPRALQTHPHLP